MIWSFLATIPLKIEKYVDEMINPPLENTIIELTAQELAYFESSIASLNEGRASRFGRHFVFSGWNLASGQLEKYATLTYTELA